MTKSVSLVLIFALAPVSCTRKRPETTAGAAHEDKKPYPAQRGVIASLPSGKDPRIVVCAAIKEVGPNGENEPSYPNPALMPFWLGENAKTAGLKEGDRIQFDLVTYWDTEKPVLITAIKKLDEKGKADLSCP